MGASALAARASDATVPTAALSTEGLRGAEAAASAGFGTPVTGLGGSAAPTLTPALAVMAEVRLPAAPGRSDFAPTLGAQVAMFVRDGVHTARLHLNPAEMGPITVQIQLDGRAAQVHLAAEHALTRLALEQAMPALAGSLRESGLTLAGGGVFEQARDNNPAPNAQGQGQGGAMGQPAADPRRAGDPATLAEANDPRADHNLDSRGMSTARGRGVVDLVA